MKNYRAYWFSHSTTTARYVTTSGHRYNIVNGLDMPDIACFVDQRYKVDAMRVYIPLPTGKTDMFAVYYTKHPRSSSYNKALLAVDPTLKWRGDLIVFRMRKLEDTCGLVNMRRGDDDRALDAVRWYVVLCVVVQSADLSVITV